jgi:hypothetical protein
MNAAWYGGSDISRLVVVVASKTSSFLINPFENCSEHHARYH